MWAATTPSVAVAALVVLLAGAAKLRSPGEAAEALIALGAGGLATAVRGWMARALALAEIALAGLALGGPGIARDGLGLLYLLFAGAAAALARRGEGCGCFGARTGPEASRLHVLLNLSFALACGLAAAAGGPGPVRMLARPAWQLAPVLAGIAAAATAAVLAYTELPRAWQAWEGTAP